MDRSLGLQEVEAPRISTQSAREYGRVVSLVQRPWPVYFLTLIVTSIMIRKERRGETTLMRCLKVAA